MFSFKLRMMKMMVVMAMKVIMITSMILGIFMC